MKETQGNRQDCLDGAMIHRAEIPFFPPVLGVSKSSFTALGFFNFSPLLREYPPIFFIWRHRPPGVCLSLFKTEAEGKWKPVVNHTKDSLRAREIS